MNNRNFITLTICLNLLNSDRHTSWAYRDCEIFSSVKCQSVFTWERVWATSGGITAAFASHFLLNYWTTATQVRKTETCHLVKSRNVLNARDRWKIIPEIFCLLKTRTRTWVLDKNGLAKAATTPEECKSIQRIGLLVIRFPICQKSWRIVGNEHCIEFKGGAGIENTTTSSENLNQLKL